MKTFLASLALIATSTLHAQTFFPFTGSYYDVVSVSLTWTQARLAAESAAYLGIPGRLAVNSYT